MALAILPFLGYCITRLLFWSCKKRFVVSEKISKEGSFVVAFWHGELLLQPFLYRQIRAQPRISVMISDHFDGEIIARMIGFFGFKTLRGSSSKGAKRVLLGAIRELEGGGDIAITPDGPRGPYHSVADGIVMISQKTGRPIVVFRAFFEEAWQLKSWDRFFIPKPFSRVTLIARDPFELSGLSLEEAKRLIHAKMTEEIE
ncbi:lysophospholipid acyltransferase family protein [Wolinella succinogenes]|uniref:lysophospholipid acyltransferase family protein n=1 Tax=Wolinella succinogenes TaxID=844 RepID=UPI002409306D|nr:lysophospholipid acyltransferase family protein [Wolinella succinogenes]